MNVDLKIKKNNLILIKQGTKKTEWRDASEYNMKRLFKPREIDGKLEGNSDIKTITFINGYSKDAEKLKIEVIKITLVRFSKFTEIPEDNFKAEEGQFSIEIILGNIVNN
jgi:hypothetical protein